MGLEMPYLSPENVMAYIAMKGGNTIFRNPALGPVGIDKPLGPLGAPIQAGGGTPGSNPILLANVISPMGPTRPQ